MRIHQHQSINNYKPLIYDWDQPLHYGVLRYPFMRYNLQFVFFQFLHIFAPRIIKVILPKKQFHLQSTQTFKFCEGWTLSAIGFGKFSNSWRMPRKKCLEHFATTEFFISRHIYRFTFRMYIVLCGISYFYQIMVV